MPTEQETFLETIEKKALEGYVAALTHVRDGIEHTDSKVITVLQSWLESAQAKLTTLTEEETAATAKAAAAGKSVGGEASAASSPAADAGNQDNAGNAAPQSAALSANAGTDAQSQAATGAGTQATGAEPGASTQDNAKSAA